MKKNKKLFIIGLISIIIILICLGGYFIINKKFKNNNSVTTTTKNNEIKSYKMVKTNSIAKCVENEKRDLRCSNILNAGDAIIEYPVLEGNTNTIKQINSCILTRVNDNIKNIENGKNEIDADGSCLQFKINKTGEIIEFEHFTILKYIVKSSDKYINIFSINDIMSSCASGGYSLNDVVIYDRTLDKIISQNEIKNKISTEKYNELKNKYYENDIYLFYSENNNISGIGYLKDSNDLLQIYELINNEWILTAEGVEIWN